ncbi:MAG TPA: hypothetical protein VHJ20_12025, partial [Polyangia bacterium]|nr:hypothetical protein [Polyangia bacterium]
AAVPVAAPVPAPAAPAAEHRPPASPSPADLAGAWEGPWNDAAHNQRGRFFLSIGVNGSVAGWMYNTSARQSYRMVGGLATTGALELTCQCPANQNFVARGGLRVDGGEVHGQLSLISPRGAFGDTRLTLRRTNAAR